MVLYLPRRTRNTEIPCGGVGAGGSEGGATGIIRRGGTPAAAKRHWRPARGVCGGGGFRALPPRSGSGAWPANGAKGGRPPYDPVLMFKHPGDPGAERSQRRQGRIPDQRPVVVLLRRVRGRGAQGVRHHQQMLVDVRESGRKVKPSEKKRLRLGSYSTPGLLSAEHTGFACLGRTPG